MLIKRIIPTLIFISTFITYAQISNEPVFGKPTEAELDMSFYPKEPDANGVVLFEKGTNTIEFVDNSIFLIKHVYRKTKVLDASTFKHANITIYLYHKDNRREKITKLKAITHNGEVQTFVKEENIFDVDESTNWKATKFAFPNVKDGSVLEYEYTIRTPFFFNFAGWEFQSDIPKIYSEFTSSIPGNYIYNRALYGNLPLFKNEVKVVPNCFSLPGVSNSANCENAIYAMKFIPSFKEEKYMLAKKNYLSRISFELETIHFFNGEVKRYSRKWKDVDKEIRFDTYLGRQLNHKSFFEKNLPAHILSISDDLERAKAVYYFIQNHYNWDGRIGIFGDNKVKKSFESSTGSNAEINLALVNALKAANLNTTIALHSTRENGLPTLKYPVLSDFNYLLAHVLIKDEHILLDASSKYAPFNVLPFKALNIQTRVMDFKNGSYWQTVVPYKKNMLYFNAQLTFEDENIISGNVSEVGVGYYAISKRIEYSNKDNLEIIKDKEAANTAGFEISDYSLQDINNLEKPVKEKYSIEYIPEKVGSKIILQPFFLQQVFSVNPFKLEERSYPVELGYPFRNSYQLSIDLQDIYTIEELPKNKKYILGNNLGECLVRYSFKDGKLSLNYTLIIKNTYFEPEMYLDLKKFFDIVAELQSQEPILLTKI